MTRTMPARLPKLQRKVIHKVPGDIDVDAIVIPKFSDQSYTRSYSQSSVQQDQKGGKMSTD